MKYSEKSLWAGCITIFLFLLACTLEANTSYAPKVAVDSSGNAVAVWENNMMTNRVIQAAVYTAGSGTWSAAVDISSAGVDSFVPALAMNTSGNAVVIWTAVNTVNSNLNLYARELPAGGAWSSIINVSDATDDVLDCRVGMLDPCYKISMNETGDIAVVWSSNGSAQHVIHAVTATFGGAWSAPVQISP